MASPPPSPEHTPSPSPSSSDEVTRVMPTSSPGSQSPSSTSAFSPSASSAPSPSTAESSEPTSSTNLPNSFNLSVASSDGGEGTGFCLQEDPSPSSSKARESAPSSSSSAQVSFEVSSSNLGLDAPSFCDIPHNSTSLAIGTCGPCPPDSSETSFISHHSLQATGTPSSSSRWPLEASSESYVSRSSWSPAGMQVEAVALDPNAMTEWPSHPRNMLLETAEVSSTGSPECGKTDSDCASYREWPPRQACSDPCEPTASTSTWSHDSVNSTEDERGTRSTWYQNGALHASGNSSCAWHCDSQNSTTETTSQTSWCHPSSTSVGLPLQGLPSTSQQHHSGSADNCSHPSTWRSRAASAPISLTRVTPTAPPPRPPTPPRPSTPPTSRHRVHIPSPTAPRRSLSPSRHFSARARRSVSPPLNHHGRVQPPPLPRRSVSPVPMQSGHAQPPSPTVRPRLSPRPRSARTPSPRPPRPPTSTPDPAPAPTQHSPRPHLAKMRGR